VAVLVLVLGVLGRLGAGGVLGRLGRLGAGGILGGGRLGAGGGGVVLGRLGAGGGGVLGGHLVVLSRILALAASSSARGRAPVVSGMASGAPARAVPPTTARCRRFFGVDHGAQLQPVRRSSASAACCRPRSTSTAMRCAASSRVPRYSIR